MAEHAKQKFLTSLLAQEQSLSSPDYQEYRAMLEQKLAAAERKVKNRWRITVGLWIATAVLILAGFSYPIFHPTPPDPQDQAAAMWREACELLVLIGNVLLFVSLLRTFLFLVFERRVPEHVRNETRDAVLMELSRKVDAIAQRLDAAGPDKTPA